MINIIQERLSSYNCVSVQEEEQAIREITQEVILAGLARTEFFKQAEFHGGTCLRIFHDLNRFSEDLDFVLTQSNKNFPLDQYLKAALLELSAYGYNFEVVDRSKADNTVKKAFIKDDSIGKLLELSYLKADRSMKKIKIKIEVDTNPPLGANSTTKYLIFPFPSSVTLHDIPSLFAGKIHALLCRAYLKGRDWYDFIWYLSKKSAVNYDLLSAQIDQSGSWERKNLKVSKEWCFEQLRQKVRQIDWPAARKNVTPFVKTGEVSGVDLWSDDFFTALIDQYLKLPN